MLSLGVHSLYVAKSVGFGVGVHCSWRSYFSGRFHFLCVLVQREMPADWIHKNKKISEVNGRSRFSAQRTQLDRCLKFSHLNIYTSELQINSLCFQVSSRVGWFHGQVVTPVHAGRTGSAGHRVRAQEVVMA